MINLSFRSDIGIDLGTSTILVYIRGKGIVLKEPSVVAIDQYTDKFLAVGEEARKMLGRTPGNIVAIRPLKDGVISDYEVTQRMLKYFIQKSLNKSIFRPRIIICVPSGITEVEKRAVIEASNNAGAIRTYIIEEPIAAAIGSDIDISQPNGSMIIDIGGGTTDIAVIALGGIVISNSIKTAGDDFDNYISRFIRRKYNILIGENTAERLKQNIGYAHPLKEELYEDIVGRDLVTGLPKSLKMGSNDVLEAIEEPIDDILNAIHSVLERTPPELAADISNRGILLTGGGSLLKGLDKLISEKTGIETKLSSNPVECVARGTGKSLNWVSILEDKKSKGGR